MNIFETSERELLRDSVQRFCAREYEFGRLRRRLDQRNGERDEHFWPVFAELGWLMAAIPAEHGGLGGDPADIAAIGEELGAGLVLEPFLGCGVLAPSALVAAGDPVRIGDVVAGIIDGSIILALAAGEPGSRGNPTQVQARAVKAEGGYRITGEKIAVLGGPLANLLLVAARIPGEGGVGGISLFLVDPAARGVARTDYRAIDNSGRTDFILDDAFVDAGQLVGEPGAGQAALEAATEIAIVAAAAEAIGAMDRALWATRDYLRVRKQFGTRLADFQVLRHRMADMYIALEQARSILLQGVHGLGEPDPALRARAVSAVKVVAGQAGRFVSAQAIQLHGGIGVTEELPVGHYFRRIAVLGSLFGSEDVHLQRCADLLSPPSHSPEEKNP